MGCDIRNLDPFKTNWLILVLSVLHIVIGLACCLPLTFKILFETQHHFLMDHNLKLWSSPMKNRIREMMHLEVVVS